jgi:diketogulonate reductase-like aldo/keto reductase
MEQEHRIHRRDFLCWLGGLSTALLLRRAPAQARHKSAILREIPSSGERLPVIGMGSWLTFDVGDNPQARAVRVQVLRTFFQLGGGMIDSSPMYGTSQEVIGRCLHEIQPRDGLFAATKVWTWGRSLGISQMEASRQLWGVPRFDLMQVHNLLDWETQLETLREHQAEGQIRYIGVTTSHGRRHDLLEQVLEREPLDFVQLTYNLVDREAEQRLLPLAAERSVAVIANRPFRRGVLVRRLEGWPLPDWAGEIDCHNWPQLLLKFIVAHPAVTCAIPATSRVDHMEENMGAGFGRLPDAELRQRLIRYVENL